MEYADSSDVWNVRFRWATLKPWLQEELLAGRYRFSPLRRFQINGESIELWASLDALVLKALAIVLNCRLGFRSTCYHLAGQDGEERGAKAAVRAVRADDSLWLGVEHSIKHVQFAVDLIQLGLFNAEPTRQLSLGSP